MRGYRGNLSNFRQNLNLGWRFTCESTSGFLAKSKAGRGKLVEYPQAPKYWLRQMREILPSGRRNTGARAPFGGLLAFRANPLAGPFAKEFFTAFQTVTLLVLIFAGRLRLPVIGRGHMFSLV